LPGQARAVDWIVFAVMHNKFAKYTEQVLDEMMPVNPLVIDVKGIFINNLKITGSVLYKKIL
jgi:hypothetical protein